MFNKSLSVERALYYFLSTYMSDTDEFQNIMHQTKCTHTPFHSKILTLKSASIFKIAIYLSTILLNYILMKSTVNRRV